MVQDPVVLKQIGKKNLYIKESHQLPLYLRIHPFYDRALARISQKINEIDGYLSVIDVGANIGDSIALITDAVQGSFLAVEGDNDYLPLLRKNVKRFPLSKIEIEESFCSDKDNTSSSFEIDNEHGTTKLVNSLDRASSSQIQFKKLDTIINEHKTFKKANLLKIDTDGFEISILKGALSFLKESKPNLFLEFSAHLYMDLGQNPLEFFHILSKSGYKKALLYDNFGKPFEIIDTSDDKKILEIIDRVDNQRIYYYDVLVYHSSKESKYKPIYESELFKSLLLFNSEAERAEKERIGLYEKLDLSSKRLELKDKEIQVVNSTVQFKDGIINEKEEIIKQKDKAIFEAQEKLKSKEAQLYLSNVESDKAKIEQNILANKMQELTLQSEYANSQYSNILTELNRIQSSRTWKMVTILRKFVHLIMPKGGLIRRTFKAIANKIKGLIRRFRESLKSIYISVKIVIQKFANLLPFKKKRKINLTSKKLVYIDHSYHEKTQSTNFLINYLKQFFDVQVIWDKSWLGEPYPDLSFIDESYLGVIFFQNLPAKEIYNKIRSKNIISFPMYDSHERFGFTYWIQYKGLKIINFSKTLHNRLKKWGFDSMYVQYFLKPSKQFKGKKNEAFFYYRTHNINIEVLKKLLGETKVKLHIHRTPDPFQDMITPTKEDEKKYSITYSDWFKNREDELKIAKTKGIYFAPREYEGIGIGFLEAMTFGKAVVAVNNPTMNEYIKHNVTGYLYDLKDPKPIDFSNIQEVQKNAYEYMQKGYEQWEKNKANIINFITKK